SQQVLLGGREPGHRRAVPLPAGRLRAGQPDGALRPDRRGRAAGERGEPAGRDLLQPGRVLLAVSLWRTPPLHPRRDLPLLMAGQQTLLILAIAAAVAGVSVLRLAWSRKQRSAALNAGGWGLMAIAVVLAGAHSGAWGISVAALWGMGAALLWLAYAA